MAREMFIPVSTCRRCDAGRDPLDVPDEQCGHTREDNALVVNVPVVPKASADLLYKALRLALRHLTPDGDVAFAAHAACMAYELAVLPDESVKAAS